MLPICAYVPEHLKVIMHNLHSFHVDDTYKKQPH